MKMASSCTIDEKHPNQLQCPSGTNDQIDGNGQVPIRTLCVHGITRDQVDDIKKYFDQFGEVESAVHFRDAGTEWCLAQFKQAKDAKEALLRIGNRWNGCGVNVADPWHQPDHPLQVAPEQDSDSNMSVALNDDCLQAIFERLKPSSLTNVAGVCKRFNQQAKETFKAKRKHLDLSKEFSRQLELIETAMEHFGKDIQSLIIDADWFMKEADAIRMIGQYCSSKLKRIELRFFEFRTDLSALRPIFSGIEHLELERCVGNISLGELMAGCVELKSLRIRDISFRGNYRCVMEQTFPKLQEVSLHDTDVSDEMFEGFVIRHPTLVKLSIGYKSVPSRFLRTIGQHAKNLQELKFIMNHRLTSDHEEQIQNDAAFIGQLSSLKKLHFDLNSVANIAVFNAIVAGSLPIESLKIQLDFRQIEDDAIKCISQLKQIKILHLTTSEPCCVTDAHVIEVTKSLPELKELHLGEYHLHNSFKSQLSTIGLRKMLTHANNLMLLKLRAIDSIKIDVDDYKAMLSTVQKRKEKLPLVIEIHDKESQVDVPAAVLAENRCTFNIKMIR